LRVGRVRRELLAHSLVAGLRQPGLRDLDLGVGELMQYAKLAYELIGVCVSHGFLLKISGLWGAAWVCAALGPE